MGDDTVKIEMSFNAPLEKLWDIWTEPQLILKWFGSDPDGKGINATMNVQPGGSYEISFQDSNGTEHTCTGKYLVVEKPNHLSFTWEWKNEPGVISTVTVSLSSMNNSTFMIFDHKDLGTASAHNYLKGWKETFGKLEKLITDIDQA